LGGLEKELCFNYAQKVVRFIKENIIGQR